MKYRNFICVNQFSPKFSMFLQSIENELLERLKRGVYDIYNYPVKEYNKVLDMEEMQPVSEEDEEVFFCWHELIFKI